MTDDTALAIARDPGSHPTKDVMDASRQLYASGAIERLEPRERWNMVAAGMRAMATDALNR